LDWKLFPLFLIRVPWKCQKCGEIIHDDSISQRIQMFLKKLGMENKWKTEVKELYEIRNNLFHRAEKDFDRNLVNQLRNILHDSIVAYIRNYA